MLTRGEFFKSFWPEMNRLGQQNIKSIPERMGVILNTSTLDDSFFRLMEVIQKWPEGKEGFIGGMRELKLFSPIEIEMLAASRRQHNDFDLAIGRLSSNMYLLPTRANQYKMFWSALAAGSGWLSTMPLVEMAGQCFTDVIRDEALPTIIAHLKEGETLSGSLRAAGERYFSPYEIDMIDGGEMRGITDQVFNSLARLS